jgi:3-O-methylgallate 3,4-dioxygenase
MAKAGVGEEAMAQVVLGIGTSHGPMLVTESQSWGIRVPADKANIHAWRGGDWSFDQLVAARAGEGLDQQITEQVWEQRQAACQSNIERLADIFAEARIDVAVIVGNDQNEIYRTTLNPAFAVHYGETILNHELGAQRLQELPPGIAASLPGYIPPAAPTIAVAPILRARSSMWRSRMNSMWRRCRPFRGRRRPMPGASCSAGSCATIPAPA